MLEPDTRVLLRVAAALARRQPPEIDRALEAASRVADALAVEEVLLQAHLFLGFPATLDGLTRWRRHHPVAAGNEGPEGRDVWAVRGPDVLARVYGDQAGRLRENVRALHPALERWMVEEGYGKVLGRDGLSLCQRELVTAVQLAVLGPSPQLFSHLRGALRVGAATADVEEAIELAVAAGVPDPVGVRQVWEDVLRRATGSDASPAEVS